MIDLSFEDFKHSILPILERQVAANPGKLEETVRNVVSSFQGTLGFTDQIKEELVKNLTISFSNTGSLPAILKGPDECKPWIEDRTDISWKQWNRYKFYLRTKKKWSEEVIQSLDDTSSQILDLLADPSVQGQAFDRRGLVMGYVQSGKTANFTAVINKAYDAGYQVVIVLAGMHNNLRSQTQIRLDEEVIGYTMKRKNVKERFVGVGLMPGYQFADIISLTNSDDDGDFSEKKAGVMFKPPVLLVVKKNKTVLTNLLNYLQKKSQFAKWVEGLEHKIIKDLPLLMIDDEADQASVNTSEIYDEDDNIDPEYDPSTINGLIRDIFQSFEQRAYVGYTATPFANMFIDKDSYTKEHGDDLFPRDFIMSLPKPNNYAGPSEYFDLYDNPDNQQTGLIRPVIQDPSFMPVGHKKYHVPKYLPGDLIQSIHAYLIATAIRRLRGQIHSHSSMLIHVTRYTDVQDCVYQLVKKELEHISDELQFDGENSDTYRALNELYKKDFVETSQSRRDGGLTFTWTEVHGEIINTLKKPLNLTKIHGKSSDILEYEEHKDDGYYVIAVGGDKLSRGLTLDGLVVSYYLRTSKVYDTLMQMGRWFGYREGYFDLCRIYTTGELAEWFYHLAVATEEIRGQLIEMMEMGITPDQYAVEVSMHPAMKITSPGKMRSGKAVKVSYSASLVQTTVFDNNKDFFIKNHNAVEQFVTRLGGAATVKYATPPENADSERIVNSKGDYFWENVSADHVLYFLENYRTVSSLSRADAESLRDYVSQCNASGELTSWTVVLINSGKESLNTIAGLNLKSGVKRKGEVHLYTPQSNTISIRILTSEGHEFLDYTREEFDAAEIILNQRAESKPKSERENLYVKSRSIRSEKQGLLLVYPLDVHQEGVLQKAASALNLSDTVIPFGFAISFPKTKVPKYSKDYMVNKSVGG